MRAIRITLSIDDKQSLWRGWFAIFWDLFSVPYLAKIGL